jgi:1-acyl-sn-glycerol-3-phosphate acyltransferase
LADPVIVQASTTRLVRPLARSGLFNTPLLGAWLRTIGAVPIYRPGDKGGDARKNKDSFARCYELLAERQTLIIFPEGQSHSDSHLHHLKSGAARLTLGALEANNKAPAAIPVGLNFSRKGRFRGDVLVNFGEAIDLTMPDDLSPRQTVREVNKRITAGLKAVTLNADSWEDVDLVRRLERFFALRRGKVRKANLSQRFSALQRLIDGQQLLREHAPEQVRSAIYKLRAYERLCRRFGVKDYHLTLKYQPWFLLVHSLRMLLTVLIGLPLVVFGLINSGLPFFLTAYLTPRFAKAKDQYDTTKILLGGGLFALFWGLQITAIYQWFGIKWMIIYIVVLLISTALAVRMRGRYGQITEDIRVFFMLLRKSELKQYLLDKRREIEVALAKLVRKAKQLSNQE